VLNHSKIKEAFQRYEYEVGKKLPGNDTLTGVFFSKEFEEKMTVTMKRRRFLLQLRRVAIVSAETLAAAAAVAFIAGMIFLSGNEKGDPPIAMTGGTSTQTKTEELPENPTNSEPEYMKYIRLQESALDEVIEHFITEKYSFEELKSYLDGWSKSVSSYIQDTRFKTYQGNYSKYKLLNRLGNGTIFYKKVIDQKIQNLAYDYFYRLDDGETAKMLMDTYVEKSAEKNSFLYQKADPSSPVGFYFITYEQFSKELDNLYFEKAVVLLLQGSLDEAKELYDDINASLIDPCRVEDPSKPGAFFEFTADRFLSEYDKKVANRQFETAAKYYLEENFVEALNWYEKADASLLETCRVEDPSRPSTFVEFQPEEFRQRVLTDWREKAKDPVYLSHLKSGDALVYGVYEQDGDPTTEDFIFWRVIENRNGELTLISQKALEAMAMSDPVTGAGARDWGKSPIRAFLNGSFYQTAFTDEEREQILLKELENEWKGLSFHLGWNGTIGIGGENTLDYVTLFSENDFYVYRCLAGITYDGRGPNTAASAYALSKIPEGEKIDVWTRAQGTTRNGEPENIDFTKIKLVHPVITLSVPKKPIENYPPLESSYYDAHDKLLKDTLSEVLAKGKGSEAVKLNLLARVFLGSSTLDPELVKQQLNGENVVGEYSQHGISWNSIAFSLEITDSPYEDRLPVPVLYAPRVEEYFFRMAMDLLYRENRYLEAYAVMQEVQFANREAVSALRYDNGADVVEFYREIDRRLQENPKDSAYWKSLKKGDMVLFGTFEQDNLTETAGEPIAWTVIDIQGDKITLQSVYSLKSMVWVEDDDMDEKHHHWDTSLVRAWLNGEFYQTAFSDKERSQIVPTKLVNDFYIVRPSEAGEFHDIYGMGGSDTEDFVYLYSLYEYLDQARLESGERLENLDKVSCFYSFYWSMFFPSYTGIARETAIEGVGDFKDIWSRNVPGNLYGQMDVPKAVRPLITVTVPAE